MYRNQNNNHIYVNGKGWMIYSWNKDYTKRKWLTIEKYQELQAEKSK